jgi:hypothetical protein
MARDFDGVDDKLVLGSDSSIDDFTTRSVAGWVEVDALAAGPQCLVGKRKFEGAWEVGVLPTGQLRFGHGWSVSP